MRNTEELTKCVCDPGEGAQTLLCGRKELQRGELSLKEGYESVQGPQLCVPGGMREALEWTA